MRPPYYNSPAHSGANIDVKNAVGTTPCPIEGLAKSARICVILQRHRQRKAFSKEPIQFHACPALHVMGAPNCASCAIYRAAKADPNASYVALRLGKTTSHKRVQPVKSHRRALRFRGGLPQQVKYGTVGSRQRHRKPRITDINADRQGPLAEYSPHG